jgi:hypothetical protein
MMENVDFITVFHAVTSDDVIQCADVKITTNRKWVRLVGLGYDIQWWAADSRYLCIFCACIDVCIYM